MTQADGPRVVLVHGLWMRGFIMLPLDWRLSQYGFRVDRHSYRSMTRSLQENARRLAAACGQHGAPIHLVGHSLGGLVIMSMLRAHPEIAVHRVVLMGSPYAHSAAAHYLESAPWSRRALGQTMQDWLHAPRPTVPEGVELGVIAGDVAFGLGKLVMSLPPPSDGVVRLEETEVPGATDSIVLHTSHSGMLVSPAVARAVCTFLRHGNFSQ